MNDAEIRAMWIYAAETWPNYLLPPTAEQREVRLAAWRDQFADVPAEAVRSALAEPGLARREWFPPLGLIRERALLAEARNRGDDQPPDVDQAWAEVRRQVRQEGYQGTPTWSHPAVAATVASFGWRELCMGAEDDTGRYRQFREFYGLASARHLAALAPPPPLAALDGSGWPRAVGRGEG